MLSLQEILNRCNIQGKILEHNGENRIFLFFEFNPAWNDAIRKVNGSRWSKTQQAWHIAANQATADELKQHLSVEPIEENIAWEIASIDYVKLLENAGYTYSLQKTYLLEFKSFAEHFYLQNPMELSKADIKQYLKVLAVQKGYTAPQIDKSVESIQFFYEQVMQQSLNNYFEC